MDRRSRTGRDAAGSTTRREFLAGVGGLAAGAALGRTERARAARGGAGARPPNVVLIVADDLGRECLGTYGGTSYATPVLDAMAAGGRRFEHAYSTPWCGPSRLQLMTGKYPLRNYEGWGKLDPARERTFAHVLKQAGYGTAAAGKWQLCHFHEPGQADHPQRCGFDQSAFWTWWFDDGSGGRVPPKYWNPAIWQNGGLRPGLEGRYGPDVCSEFLVQFIEGAGDAPFLVYYPLLLPHGPFEPTPDSGLLVRAIHQMPTPVQVRVRGPVFSDYIAYMDGLVGRILDALDRRGIRQDTLVLFTADNGTDKNISSSFAGRTRAGGKGSLTDLGIRVPLLASWPGTVPAGSVCEDLVDLSDFLPTLAELSGGDPGTGLDGKSFVPELLDRSGPRREWIYAETWYPERDSRAVRGRDWKLLEDGRLFDMRRDPFEERPLRPGEGGPEAAAARRRLLAVIEGIDASDTRGPGPRTSAPS